MNVTDVTGRQEGAALVEASLGQYWMHAACLRNAAHSSVPLHFLDLAEEGPDRDP